MKIFLVKHRVECPTPCWEIDASGKHHHLGDAVPLHDLIPDKVVSHSMTTVREDNGFVFLYHAFVVK